MSDIESMKAALEAAGYVGEWLAFGAYQEFSFIFGDGIEIHDSDKDKAIEYAYAHLQREKKFAAMEAYLTEVYELILSRAGAEQAQGVKLSFASCLPTPLLIKLEKLLGKGE